MTSSQKSLARHVAPSLPEARLARQYDAIEARVGGARRLPRWAAVSIAFAVVAAVVAFVFVAPKLGHRTGTPALADGTVLESGDDTGSSVTLSDGSQLALDRRSRARLAELHEGSVRIELERGGVEIEATHVEGRKFVVAAAGYEVSVIGTHFVVRTGGASLVSVRVDRGKVEVRAPNGEVRAISSGETFSVAATSASASSSSNLELAPSSSAAEPSYSIAPIVTAAGAPQPGAKELLETAQKAKAEGKLADAARAFDTIRRKFRGDPRAGLAAFELGRLRLDALGDPRGAEEALRDALTLSPGAPFREDAEARRVQALSRMGDEKGCAAARDVYLSRYPSGLYRKTVALYCAPP